MCSYIYKDLVESVGDGMDIFDWKFWIVLYLMFLLQSIGELNRSKLLFGDVRYLEVFR